MAGQPLENLDALVRALREQQPQLPNETLHRGIGRRRRASCQAAPRCSARLSRGGPRPTQAPRRGRTGTQLDPGSDERWS